MNPAELDLALQLFRDEVAALDGDGLLDRWIALKGSDEVKVPDLGIGKSLYLEAALIGKFGIEYHKAVEARAKAKSDNA